MATYMLVHGGDGKGDDWCRVADLLRKAGHHVFTPTMQSIKTASLQDNIKEVTQLILANDSKDIVLVGHSYGAMVITGVLQNLPERITALVYVDSVLPQSGKSLFGLLKESGFDYKAYGLTEDPACMEILNFDQKILQSRPKVYIRCLQSEFDQATAAGYQYIVSHAKRDNWLYLCLDTSHACMQTQPEALSLILGSLTSRVHFDTNGVDTP